MVNLNLVDVTVGVNGSRVTKRGVALFRMRDYLRVLYKDGTNESFRGVGKEASVQDAGVTNPVDFFGSEEAYASCLINCVF